MILKIALMSYSFIPSKCFLPGGQLNFQSGADFLGRFELIAADFMTVELKATFDISIIVGVFDYIESPQPFLHKAAAAARKSVIATFPRAGTVRSCLRRCRLSLKGCPVYFYTKKDIEKLSDACGLLVKHYEKIGQLHCVVLVKR